MSHDFPDGPDYNPEPLDDDPWDSPYAHPDPPECDCFGLTGTAMHDLACPNYTPPASTTADLSPSQP